MLKLSPQPWPPPLGGASRADTVKSKGGLYRSWDSGAMQIGRCKPIGRLYALDSVGPWSFMGQLHSGGPWATWIF